MYPARLPVKNSEIEHAGLEKRRVKQQGKGAVLQMLKMRCEGCSDTAIAAAVGFRPSEVERILALFEEHSEGGGG